MDRIFYPALDGLRFIAFLAVFMLHSLPIARAGWIGVELFFAISSFLFFRLMRAEWDRTHAIDASRFYIRRLLRLYPLMAAFPLLMLSIYGAPAEGTYRLTGLLTVRDNIIAMYDGWNPIAFTKHLWTLSAEFQLYLFIPALFIVSREVGEAKFVGLLCILAVIGIAARFALVQANVPHPVIWVMPALHPEATLLGMGAALTISNRLEWRVVAVVAVLAAIAFIALPAEYMKANGRMWVYPIAGLVCASAVWLAAKFDPALLRLRWISYLGKISFGLYVFHLLGLHLGNLLVPHSLPGRFAVSLAITIAMAVLSYEFFERPCLRLKSRFEVVPSRPL